MKDDGMKREEMTALRRDATRRLFAGENWGANPSTVIHLLDALADRQAELTAMVSALNVLADPDHTWDARENGCDVVHKIARAALDSVKGDAS